MATNSVLAARTAAGRISRFGTGLLGAAVALASAIVALTIGVRIAGTPVLRDHANGAILALLGMGVPIEVSSADRAVGASVTPTQYPALLAATVVVVTAALAVGWTRARRQPDRPLLATVAPATAWFAALSALLAVVISHGRAVEFAGASVRISASAPLSSLLAAVWSTTGMAAGAYLARRVNARSPRAQREGRSWLIHGPGAIAVAAAVTVVGVGACGTGGSPSRAAAGKGDTGERANAPTTSTTLAPTTTVTVAASSATGTASTARSSTTRATTPAKSNSPVAAVATGVAPAAAGTYHYNTSGSTSSLLGKKTFPSVTTLTVDAAAGNQQHSVRQLMSPNGEGFIIEQTLQYRPDGVAVVQRRLSLTQSGDKTVRTLNARPPTVVIPTGAPVGTHREFDLSGMLDGREVVDILESGTVTIAGQQIPAVRIKSVLTVTGSVSGTIQLDQWWAPSLRLAVKESLVGTFKSGFITVKTQYDATLQRLTP